MLSTKNTCLSMKHKSRGSLKKTQAFAKTFKNLFKEQTPITRKATNPTMESSHVHAKDSFLKNLFQTATKSTGKSRKNGKDGQDRKKQIISKTNIKKPIPLKKKPKKMEKEKKNITSLPKKKTQKSNLQKVTGIFYPIDQSSEYIENNRDIIKKSLNRTSRITANLLTKISKVFDLVHLQISLPFQVQTLFGKAIKNLRYELNTKGTQQIGHLIRSFKDDCLQICKYCSNDDVERFMRCDLPNASRWNSVDTSVRSAHQVQLQKRSRYFSSLSRKVYIGNDESVDDHTLARIQNKINDYLERSRKLA